MRKFNYENQSCEHIDANLEKTISSIIEQAGQLKFLTKYFQNEFTELQSQTIVDEAYYSAKIEGMQLNYGRLAKMVDNPIQFPAQNELEKQALGNAFFIKALFRKLDSFEVDTTSMLAMFQVIFSINGANTKSLYRRFDKQKVLIEGKIEEVEVSPVNAFESPLYTGSAISALADSLCDNTRMNLINIAKLNVDLMCIRPFDSGAGRIIRIFTQLCMLKSGIEVFKYVSLSKTFEASANRYYETLNLCSDKWIEGKNNYMPFVHFFINTLQKAYNELFRKFEICNKQSKTSNSVTIRYKPSCKSSLSKPEQISAFFQKADVGKAFSKQDISFHFPNISMSTIENTLGQLVKDKKIIKVGSGKTTKYSSV